MQDLRPAPSIAAKDWLTALNQFETQGLPYALVTVLRVEPPASARAGDKAVVTSDGAFYGWIGGGCAQPVVKRAIEETLHTGLPMTIRITPQVTEGAEDGIRQVPMACHSGGSVELFIEPHRPAAPLHVYGQAPVARVLSDLASRVGIPVISIPQVSTPQDQVRWAVIATQGQGDVQAIRDALGSPDAQIWFIASARKWAKIQQELMDVGIPRSDLNRIISPAGVPIGAKTPEEIALSVLAAVVGARRGVPSLAQDPPVLINPQPVPPAPARSCCGGTG